MVHIRRTGSDHEASRRTICGTPCSDIASVLPANLSWWLTRGEVCQSCREDLRRGVTDLLLLEEVV